MPRRQWKRQNGKRRWTRLRALPRLHLLANLGKAEIVSDENVRLVVNKNLRIGKPVAKTQRLAASVPHLGGTANPLRTDSGVSVDPTTSVRDRSGHKPNRPPKSLETSNQPAGARNQSQSRFKTARNWRPPLVRYWGTSSLL